MLIRRITMLKLCQFKRYSFSIVNHSTISKIFHEKVSGDTVEIKGWVKSMRKMKEHVFFDVSDGSCTRRLQVVIPQDTKNSFLTTGCSISAVGKLNTSPLGQLELHANKINVLGVCVINEGYPFAPRKIYPPEYIRQYLHLRPRTNKFASLLRIRDAINFEINNYLHSNGFVNIHSPILTSNDCEGAGEVFTIIPDNEHLLKGMHKPNVPKEEIYFGSKVYLSVSGQLHLEAAAHGLSKVYTFGPTFRAENSKSRHHLSEFYMLEVEIAFVDSVEELISFVENLIKSVSLQILNKHSDDIANFQSIDDSSITMYINKPYHVLTFDEATSILNKNTNKLKVPYNNKGQGLSKEQEMFLVKHCGAPVFIVNWPKYMKPFYMKDCKEDNTKVAALDFLGPNVGEVVGGSLRENDYEKLKAKIPEGNTNMDWYLELRKFGSVPTAGFGLGLERFIQSLLAINNIKDTIPFPRWAHNCSL